MFCLTGDFVYAPRSVCEREIEARGGVVGKGVTKAWASWLYKSGLT